MWIPRVTGRPTQHVNRSKLSLTMAAVLCWVASSAITSKPRRSVLCTGRRVYVVAVVVAVSVPTRSTIFSQVRKRQNMFSLQHQTAIDKGTRSTRDLDPVKSVQYLKEQYPDRFNMVQFSNDKIHQLRSESKSDPILSSLQDIIVSGWPNRRDEIPKQLRPYWCYRDELSVEDGVILKGERVLIPKSMQADVVQGVHAGHQGIEKCKLRAKSCVYWNGINNDIEEVVKRCETCQEHQRSNTTETLMPHELPTRAWQILGTDLFHFDNKEYLIVADYYSKFPFIRKMPTPCTSHAVVTATADIFSEHGSPEKVVSDNGGHYDCANYRNFAE